MRLDLLLTYQVGDDTIADVTETTDAKGIEMAKSLTKAELNVLEAIIEQTVITRGPRKGQVKDRVSASCYYVRCTRKLAEAGLIDLRFDTVNGDGYAATPKALMQISSLKKAVAQ